MRHFDLTPLYKTTVGFDRLASLIDSIAGFEGEGQGFPPYNIERRDENKYRISMAVAGFSADDLKIEVKENTLSIHGEQKPEKQNESRAFLHQGIASRVFERRFQLADYVEATGAEMKDGLLHVDLTRNIPEAMKPRVIAINAPTAQTAHVIEGIEDQS